MINYINIRDEIGNILTEASKLKRELIKIMIRSDDSDLSPADDYLLFINGFGKKWEDMANDIMNDIRKADPDSNVKSIPYSDVKRYIYASYDYASILPFADGCLKGIESGKFTENEDVVDYMSHCTNKAFKGLADSVGGVVGELIEDTSSDQRVNDSSKFNTLKGYQFIDRRDRVEMYKAIDGVLDYMIKKLIKRTDNDAFSTNKMLISMINAVIDYASFTLTAYAARIYALHTFVTPYVRDRKEIHVESGDRISKSEIRTMKDAEDIAFRDPEKFQYAKSILDEFILSIGGDSLKSDGELFQTINTSIIGNPLFKITRICDIHDPSAVTVYDSKMENPPTNIIEYAHLLGTYLQNPQQGLEDVTSPKQDLFYAIRTAKPESETLEKYVRFTANLATIFKVHLEKLTWFMQSANRPVGPDKMNITPAEQKAFTNTLSMIKGFYGELADATLFKFRDLEAKINRLKGTKSEEIIDSLNIRVPGIKDDYSSDQNMMMGLPEMARNPIEDIPSVEDNGIKVEYYALPSYEFYRMYDEFAKSILGDDVLYYSEAFDFSRIIAAILSGLDGIMTNITTFLANGSVKKAAEWVSKNQAALRGMRFKDPMPNILPFQKDMSLSFLNTFIAQVKGFDPKALTTDEAVDNYFNNIFGQDSKVNKIFDEDVVKKENQHAVFNNYIAFNIDPVANPTGKVTPKQLNNDAEIKKELEIWIGNVVSYKDGLDAVTLKIKELKGAVNSLKGKVTSMNVGTSTNTTTTSPEVKADDKTGAETSATSQPNQEQKVAQTEVKVQNAVVKLQGLTASLCRSLVTTLIGAIKTQYSYIQQAEQIGKGGNTQQNQQQQQNK